MIRFRPAGQIAMAMVAAALVSGCGGGDDDAQPAAVASGGDELRPRTLAATPAAPQPDTTALTIRSSASHAFAAQAPAADAPGALTAQAAATGRTIKGLQFQILAGEPDRPPLKLTRTGCSGGTKPAANWNCDTQVVLDGPANLRRPFEVVVSATATATAGNPSDTTAVATALTLLPADAHRHSGTRLFSGSTQKTRWGLKSTDGGGTDAAMSLHLPGGESYLIFGTPGWADAFSFVMSLGTDLVDGWLKGPQVREFDFRRGQPLALEHNAYLVKPGATVGIKGLIHDAPRSLVYAYDLTVAPLQRNMAPANLVGNYLGTISQMSPQTVDTRVLEHFGYTIRRSGSSYLLEGITSAAVIEVTPSADLQYSPSQVRCTVSATLSAGSFEYANASLSFSGEDCTLRSRQVLGVMLFNYGAGAYMVAGADDRLSSAALSQAFRLK